MSRPKHLRRAALAGGLLAGLAVPSAAFAADPASTAVVLTTDNKISTFETAFPTEATAPVAVTGLVGTDRLVGIDVRPQNGQLYGVAANAADDTIRVYTISARTAIATPLGTPIPAAATLDATKFGVDFNPAVDRLRVVSDSGLNLRIDPNTGVLVAADTAINPVDSKVDAAAYTSNQQNAAVTTLYTLSGANNRLYIQTGTDGTPSPNDGEQTASRSLKVNGIEADFGAAGGFDIAPGVAAVANNGDVPTGGAGYAAFKVGTLNFLVKIDLFTGNTTPVGLVGNGATDVEGLAILQETTPGGLPSVALTTDDKIRRFNSATPGTGTDGPAIVGTPAIPAGDKLVAIDWRPQTGQLLALSVNATNNTGNLYRVDPQTGAATRIGSADSVAFQTPAGAAVDLPDPATTSYDIDVNPTVDRVRVVTSSGLNFRLNPTVADAAPVAVDGNNGGVAVLPNVNTDGDLNNGGVGTTGADIFGTAYTNSYGQAAAIPATQPTTQYGLSVANDQLLIQNPPNAGTQTAPKPLTLSGSALDITGVKGFDIPPAVAVTTNNAVAAGKGLAALTVGGTTGLYAIDLTTGATTNAGAFTTAPASFATGDGPPAPKDRPVTPPVVTPPVVTPPVVTPPVVTPPVVTPPKPASFGSSTKLTVKLRATKISSKGPAKVTFRNTNKFAVKVRIQATTPKSGKRKAIKYATKTYTVKASSSRTVNVRLPSAARKVLSSKKKLTIKVTLKVTAPDKKSRTVRKTLTARKK
ncbi:DUF4394 domain-containing protein [Patulibacter minatonensis]|uniref:DUF4394 domain-containing protein n=1 Tax=Patulibacter minatonensis TaxID=298163 RepID=UPI00047EB714|nr:DUF4394 domain-containing protein [Patulibacter minatonensis]